MIRPHISWPVRFGADGNLVTVEQDSDDDIASCMGVILSWPLGTRPTDANFGVADQALLQGGANLEEIRQAILQSEPRAASLGVMQDDAQLAQYVSDVTVGFTARETG